MAIHIKDILQNCLFDRDEWQLTVLQQWSTIVGPLHDKMRLQRIQGSTVIIGVYDSRWMHELYYMQQLLLEKINQVLSVARLDQIRFVLVKRNSSELQKPPSRQLDAAPAHTGKPLSQKAIQILNKIKDAELRSALITMHHKTK